VIKRAMAVLLGLTLSMGVVTTVASPAGADDLFAIPWTDLLPGLTDQFDATSENDCTAGRIQCVHSVIREMDRRFQPLAQACAHNSMFSLMYMRTTEMYLWAATTEGFFTDTPFINHQDVVFARYYFDAWDKNYETGHESLPPVPGAWRVAFQSADAKRVSSTGNMFLGMSAHVNNDLPQVLAAIGLTKPDGSSRKPDHDKVNQFLVRVIEPLFDEAARRFDPTVDDGSVDGTHLDETATLNVLQGWREQAWRNAERLVMATTATQRAAVKADIERTAEREAYLIVAATAYDYTDYQSALGMASMLGATASELADAAAGRAYNVAHGVLGGMFTNSRAQRDAYCATHWNS
jgi:hypothetical protein